MSLFTIWKYYRIINTCIRREIIRKGMQSRKKNLEELRTSQTETKLLDKANKKMP